MGIKYRFLLPVAVAVFGPLPDTQLAAQTFATLHSFTANVNGYNTDGVFPRGGVILSENTLYGTAQVSGSLGLGTVFKINTDSTGFGTLHNFTGSD